MRRVPRAAQPLPRNAVHETMARPAVNYSKLIMRCRGQQLVTGPGRALKSALRPNVEREILVLIRFSRLSSALMLNSGSRDEIVSSCILIRMVRIKYSSGWRYRDLGQTPPPCTAAWGAIYSDEPRLFGRRFYTIICTLQ